MIDKIQLYLFRHWWFFLLAVFCLALYEKSASSYRVEKMQLKERLMEIRKRKELQLALQQDLLLQIESQDDPAYIELILMRDLGLVPRGQMKVVFYD